MITPQIYKNIYIYIQIKLLSCIRGSLRLAPNYTPSTQLSIHSKLCTTARQMCRQNLWVSVTIPAVKPFHLITIGEPLSYTCRSIYCTVLQLSIERYVAIKGYRTQGCAMAKLRTWLLVFGILVCLATAAIGYTYLPMAYCSRLRDSGIITKTC